ncbi:hypothetical protein Tsubulata_006841 [Turnera subulata]|uniref:F-box domain-containing protein n=1 Tax=Turnera subulata TaxID=218843 RepID=A0A9Q0GAH7_9ROSI|nr:hypothetical protein Tsubulata_006841 [Turnera subulata]
MSSSGAVNKRKREECRDYNRLLVVEAKPTNTERLVISTNMTAPNRSYLPPDIVEHILDLLPRKSIDRFRSVSKSLFSLLAIKFDVPKLLYRPRKGDPRPSNYGIKSSDDQSLFTGVGLSDYSGNAKNQGYMAAPELSGPVSFDSFIGSCNGLVCLAVTDNYYGKSKTFVWNPFTGICRKLPHRNNYAFGFGYDSASDGYKVFAATAPHRDPQRVKVEIFSLKTGSWKDVENPGRKYLQHIPSWGRMGLFLNGALHWVHGQSAWGIPKIIAFELSKEKFYHVPSPPNQSSPGKYGDSCMGVVGEYLCMCVRKWHTKRASYIVWVMKDYCNEASWIQFISYSFPRIGDGIEARVEYVCDFISRSFMDGRYMMLQFANHLHVLKWKNNLNESDEAEKYSKKIKLYEVLTGEAIPYTQTLTSPYAS